MRIKGLMIILLSAILFMAPALNAQPNADINLAPVNPPIIVPAQGGSFQFTASLINNGPTQVQLTVWMRIRFPNGTYTAFG